MRTRVTWIVCLVACAAFSHGLKAQQSLSLVRIYTGLSSPLYATSAPGDPGYLYVVERGGNIRVLNLSTTPATLLSTPFLSSTQLSLDHGLTSGGERGLLGLAFHPDYATNRRYYVYYTDNSGNARVRSFQQSSTTVRTTDPSTRANILQISQPYSNHNGGWMSFGADGFLYIASGDGGDANDPGNVAQNRNSLLGKILRIAPSTDTAGSYQIPSSNPWVGQTGVRQEVWAYGLRNPWRCSFDRATGDFYMADVGQGAREEINFQYAASPGGENYGWRLREGTIQTPGSVGGSRPAGNVEPIYDYVHGSDPFQGNSVTGGYVYRGPIPGLQGHYFFGDYVSRRLFSLRFNQSLPTLFDGSNHNSLIDWTSSVQLDVGSLGGISSFGEDSDGNLYLINLGGNIYRFQSGNIPEPVSVLASFVYHAGWSGTATPQWDAIDQVKILGQPGPSPTLLGFNNLINTVHGINGVVFDIQHLNDPGQAVWQYKQSPQGAFVPAQHPLSGWEDAPTPIVTVFSGQGTSGSDRFLLQWPNNSINNRWLSVKLTVGNLTTTRVLGHLRGETTGPEEGMFSVMYGTDAVFIRSSIATLANAGSIVDIDKNGSVQMADMVAVRSNVGTQLPQITLPSQP